MDIFLFNNLINPSKKEKLKEGFSIKDISFVPNKVAIILISFVSIYLCWNANEDTNFFVKIIYCIFAFIFSGIYLIYYYFMHFRESQNNKEFNFI
jgi:hypothetical protein